MSQKDFIGVNPADKEATAMSSKLGKDFAAGMAECEKDYKDNARDPTVGATGGQDFEHGTGGLKSE